MYKSIEDIRQKFKIKSSDREAVRQELNLKRSSIHPDKNKGNFASKKDEELYISLSDAIEAIDNNQFVSNSLVSVSEITELVKVVTELLPTTKQNYIEQAVNEKIRFSLDNYHRRTFVPKIGLTAITSIVTFLFIFPKTITEHPVLKVYFNPESSGFAFTWFALLFYTCIFWFYIYRREEKAKYFVNSLKTERTQNDIFKSFTSETSYRSDDSKVIFSKDELTLFVLKRYNHRNSSTLLTSLDRLLGGRLIDEDLAQSISDILISKAQSKKIIEKIENNDTITDLYQIKAIKGSR